MIELILWRHADAHNGWPDLERELTREGREQARLTAEWLKPRLPSRYWLLSSPAVRARQTASALSGDIRVDERLIPGAEVGEYAEVIDWPHGPQGCPGLLIVVAHQPILGAIAARLMTGMDYGWEFGKSSVWWFSAREPDARGQTVLRAMMTPALL